jgi:hypothetical protein
MYMNMDMQRLRKKRGGFMKGKRTINRRDKIRMIDLQPDRSLFPVDLFSWLMSSCILDRLNCKEPFRFKE